MLTFCRCTFFFKMKCALKGHWSSHKVTFIFNTLLSLGYVFVWNFMPSKLYKILIYIMKKQIIHKIKVTFMLWRGIVILFIVDFLDYVFIYLTHIVFDNFVLFFYILSISFTLFFPKELNFSIIFLWLT